MNLIERLDQHLQNIREDNTSTLEPLIVQEFLKKNMSELRRVLYEYDFFVEGDIDSLVEDGELDGYDYTNILCYYTQWAITGIKPTFNISREWSDLSKYDKLSSKLNSFRKMEYYATEPEDFEDGATFNSIWTNIVGEFYYVGNKKDSIKDTMKHWGISQFKDIPCLDEGEYSDFCTILNLEQYAEWLNKKFHNQATKEFLSNFKKYIKGDLKDSLKAIEKGFIVVY